MNKLLFIISLCLLTPFSSFSQENINNYKYVIVPNQYEFLKEADQFQLNSLTKFLFNKYGFTALLENEDFPEELNNNRCLALFANVSRQSSFLKTKLQVQLKDCNNKIVYTSQEGETREKEFDKAYNLALRGAFESIQALNHKYTPSTKSLSKSVVTSSENNTNSKEEIQRLQEELKALKEEINLDVEPTVVNEKMINKETVTKTVSTPKESSNTLYAQAINMGFQVVDSTPKVVMILLSTSKANTFIVKGEQAIVYEEDGFWYISKNDGKNVSVERLDIKF